MGLGADKLSIYKQIARDALMSWNGLSYEEATQTVLESTVEQLEQQVHAENSIDYALKGLQKFSHNINRYSFNDINREKFKKIIMTGQEEIESGFSIDGFHEETESASEYINSIMYYIKSVIGYNLTDKNDIILSVLSNIHDGWVKDNPNKFMARDKKYQHMPIELIGWNEAKSDLLFLKPILDATQITYSEKDLERSYNSWVRTFLREKGITDINTLREQISRGAEFYPTLEGQQDIIQALQDSKFVEEQVIRGIRDKGIGTNEQFLQQLFSEKTSENTQELEDLRDQKQQLEREAELISETEKLITERDGKDQNPDLDS